jgi:transcription elongation factor SPT5
VRLFLLSDFIDDTQDDDDIRGNDVRRRPMPHPSSMMEDEEALEEYLRRLRERSGCGTTSHSDYVEEVTEVEQQALLPSVKDPKLWMVKCAVG